MLENRTLEIIIIAVVVLLLFGAKRLPDAARGLGKSLRIFKSEVNAMKTDAGQPAPVTPKSIDSAVAAPNTAASEGAEVAGEPKASDPMITAQF